MQLPLVRVAVGGPAAISLGRAQRALQPVPVLPAKRRTSGGGAVLMGPWQLRALVVLPRSHEVLRPGPAATARWLGEVHRAWLQEHGITPLLHDGPQRQHWACFAGVSTGELLVDGRKITGFAQTWRRARALLWSATLITPPPWERLCEAMEKPLAEARLIEAATIAVSDCLVAPWPVDAAALDLQGRLWAAVNAADGDRRGEDGAPGKPGKSLVR